MKNRLFITLLVALCAGLFSSVRAQETRKIYLSGTGFGNTVKWDFYCTEGRNSGKWKKIEVPSQWELQGFGEYTYGRWYKDKDRNSGMVRRLKNPSMEQGIYRHTFSVPAAYQGQQVSLVFDGVMTDTEVSVNGQVVGPKHQGGFYRFSYDITDFISFGKKNILEVTVWKHSSNKSVNNAERKADWWLFGGIYRPVFLEIKPMRHIDRLAVNARADGSIDAQVFLSGIDKAYTLDATLSSLATGEVLYGKLQAQAAAGDSVVTLSGRWNDVRAWNPEDPNLYVLSVSLRGNDGTVLHRYDQRIGFRTVDFRPKDGLYVNGVKVILKGINRHSFWPDAGRTTNKQISIDDVKLIKEMNMNAIRCHYPPDDHFLDVCDSLGVFFIDELAGWQNSYDTQVGSRLLAEMLTRDVNHPSIIIWSNGNEGGWNKKLDPLFALYDPQKRHVIHPWADFDELDTHHYPAYLTGVARFTYGYKLFMPTEFMHGQYDQGHGAGLEDFWNSYTSHPLFVGGFMWDFCDNAVRRSDRNGELDSDGFNAPDGILGPYREKEGSYYTVRDIWAPIQVEKFFVTPSFNGRFKVSNDYLYTSLDKCRMAYKLYKVESPLSAGKGMQKEIGEGVVKLPALAPGEQGYASMELPSNFFDADILEITAYNPDGSEMCTRTWSVGYARDYWQRHCEASSASSPAVCREQGNNVTLSAGGVEITFDKSTGYITRVLSGKQPVSFANGPIPVGMVAAVKSTQTRMDGDTAVFAVKYNGNIDSIVWRMSPEGLLDMSLLMLNRSRLGGGLDDAATYDNITNLGITFSYPESCVTGMRWLGGGPYRVWKNRLRGANMGVWEKAYNNTITGESFENLIYPEFKGYHSNLYWATIQNKEQDFTVYSMSDGVYLRMLTPEEPKNRQGSALTMPAFPAGDISFLLEIPAIRCFKPISQHGPKSQPGTIRIKSGDEGIHFDLGFDFRKKQ